MVMFLLKSKRTGLIVCAASENVLGVSMCINYNLDQNYDDAQITICKYPLEQDCILIKSTLYADLCQP